jgi:Rrf2 family protein
MITQKMKYALKSMMVLADERAGAGDALRIEEIARRAETPKRFLEHILLEIRNAGYIASIRGRNGGYLLIKDPAAIPLSELLRMIDGPIAPLTCLSRRAYQRCDDCADETTCRIRKVFAEVFWSYLVLIESLTLADLLDQPAAAQQVLSVASA